MLVPYNDPFYTAGGRRWRCRPANVLQIGTDSSQRRARPASAADRPEADLRPGPAGAHPAHRLQNQSRSHFHGHRHLVDRRSRQLARDSAGSAAISIRCRRRSIRWSAGTRPASLPHVLQARTRGGAGDPEPGRLRVLEPEHRRRSGGRAHRGARASPRTCRSIGRSWRSSTAARRRRWRRSIASRPSRRYTAVARLSEHRLRAGAAGGGRRDDQGDRHAGLLRDDRRLRHALGAERQRGQRRLLQPDGDAERRRCSRSTTT